MDQTSPPKALKEAVLRYATPEFTIVKDGDYVICAVTGQQILLRDLRYWDPESQEAYVDAAAATKAWKARQEKAKS